MQTTTFSLSCRNSSFEIFDVVEIKSLRSLDGVWTAILATRGSWLDEDTIFSSRPFVLFSEAFWSFLAFFAGRPGRFFFAGLISVFGNSGGGGCGGCCCIVCEKILPESCRNYNFCEIELLANFTAIFSCLFFNRWHSETVINQFHEIHKITENKFRKIELFLYFP